MTYTSNCDFYVAVQDAGINRILHHVMLQRPSLFNYGSILPLTNPHPICNPIQTVPQVEQANNPLITSEPRLPLLALTDPSTIIESPLFDFIVQLTQGAIDFFPDNIITLPPGFNPPFAAQQFAVHFQVCAGLICPPQRERKNIDCFCLDLFASGGCRITTTPGGQQAISMNVSDIEIPELAPAGMEEALKCYALYTLNQGIIPGIAKTISQLAFSSIALPNNMGSLTLSASTSVPNNPAIQDNQIETFVNLDNITLNIPITPGGGGGSTGTVTRTTRLRQRVGTFDATAAVSASTLEKIFNAFVKGFTFSKSGSSSFGPFSVSYDVAAHLEGGSLVLQNNGPGMPGSIVVNNLVVVWDKLKLNLGFTFPNLCVGGGSFCAVPPWPSCSVPLTGCAACVTTPQICLFNGNPTITIPIDLGGGLLASEVTLGAELDVFYGVGSGIPNQWQIVATPTLPFALDIIDFAYTMQMLENAVQNIIDNLLSGLPSWAVDAFNTLLGGITNIISDILQIPYDLEQWFTEMLTQIGIFDSLLQDLYNYISLQMPAAYTIDDPFIVLPTQNGLIPVKIPIEFIGIQVTPQEIVIEADVGN
jgi:hypothetical protein